MFNFFSKELSKSERRMIRDYHSVIIKKRKITAVLNDDELWLMVFCEGNERLYVASDNPTLYINGVHDWIIQKNNKAYSSWKGNLPDEDFRTGMNKAITELAQKGNVILRIENSSRTTANSTRMSLSGYTGKLRTREDVEDFIQNELQYYHSTNI